MTNNDTQKKVHKIFCQIFHMSWKMHPERNFFFTKLGNPERIKRHPHKKLAQLPLSDPHRVIFAKFNSWHFSPPELNLIKSLLLISHQLSLKLCSCSDEVTRMNLKAAMKERERKINWMFFDLIPNKFCPTFQFVSLPKRQPKTAINWVRKFLKYELHRMREREQ